MSVIQYSFKLPITSGPTDHEVWIPVFHDWIRTKAIDDDVLVDVADYAHVQGGPGVLLVCHEGQYVIDRSRGQVGLAYHRRRGVVPDDATEGAAVSLRRLVKAAKLIASDERTKSTVFDTTKLEVRVLDRLRVGNDDAGWGLVREPLQAAIAGVWGGDVKVVRADVEARQPLTVWATMGARALGDLDA
jgi:hypothetical protein